MSCNHRPTGRLIKTHILYALNTDITTTDGDQTTANNNNKKRPQPKQPQAPIPTLEWHPPTPQCRAAVEAAVSMQGKGDIGFFEAWSEEGPLGNPLQKRMGACGWGVSAHMYVLGLGFVDLDVWVDRYVYISVRMYMCAQELPNATPNSNTEGAFHDEGPRTCMGHGRKLVNATDGRLSAFGLALCSDHVPAEGMVCMGVCTYIHIERELSPLDAFTIKTTHTHTHNENRWPPA